MHVKHLSLHFFSGNTAGNSAGSSPTNVSRTNGLFLTEPVGGSAQFTSSRAWIAGNANPPTRIGKYIYYSVNSQYIFLQ